MFVCTCGCTYSWMCVCSMYMCVKFCVCFLRFMSQNCYQYQIRTHHHLLKGKIYWLQFLYVCTCRQMHAWTHTTHTFWCIYVYIIKHLDCIFLSSSEEKTDWFKVSCYSTILVYFAVKASSVFAFLYIYILTK